MPVSAVKAQNQHDVIGLPDHRLVVSFVLGTSQQNILKKIIPKYSKDSSTEGFGGRESDSTGVHQQALSALLVVASQLTIRV